MKRVAIVAAILLAAFSNVQADQTGDCTAGSEFCENNNQTTTSTATNTNTNTNTNTSTNTNTNTNTSTSTATATVSAVAAGSTNITSRYTLDTGQRYSYYDILGR